MNNQFIYTSVADLKANTDAVQLISEIVELKRKGNRYWGLCPFHQEKTPSFTVDPAKQIFCCFGCHAKGDVIDFVQKYYHLSFNEANKWLTERYGIPLEGRINPATAAMLREEVRERQRKKEYAQKTLAEMRERLKKLTFKERFYYLVLRTVRTPDDLDRELVNEALKILPRLSYSIDQYYEATTFEEQQEALQAARRVTKA